jgi:leader peptidase (prepilin peptidase)/N-methyltransferase
VLSLTDLDEYVIPNVTIIVAIAIRLAYILAEGFFGNGDMLVMLRDAAIGGVSVAVPVLLLALVMDRVLGRESLGGGDIKLLFVAGLYFGWQQCLFLLMVACVLGLVFAAIGRRGAGSSDDSNARLIPFGPSIAAACWITMLFGEQVLRWYLTLFL